MQEAGASYRAWAPIAAAPWLLEKTMAKAAELAGADWSEEIAETAAVRTPGSLPGMPSAYLAGPGVGKPSRRRAMLAAGPAALLLLAALGSVLAGDDPPAEPAAGTAPGPSTAAPEAGAKAAKAGKATGNAAKRQAAKKKKAKTRTTAAETTPAQAATGGTPSEPTSRPNRPPGGAAVQPPRRASAPKPGPRPKPAPKPASTPPRPAPAPSPPAEEPSPAEGPEGPGESIRLPELPGTPLPDRLPRGGGLAGLRAPPAGAAPYTTIRPCGEAVALPRERRSAHTDSARRLSADPEGGESRISPTGPVVFMRGPRCAR